MTMKVLKISIQHTAAKKWHSVSSCHAMMTLAIACFFPLPTKTANCALVWRAKIGSAKINQRALSAALCAKNKQNARSRIRIIWADTLLNRDHRSAPRAASTPSLHRADMEPGCTPFTLSDMRVQREPAGVSLSRRLCSPAPKDANSRRYI